MATSKRKRFSAFDDFQAPQDEPLPASNPSNVSSLFSSQLRVEPVQQVERIERLKPSQMLPDRFQPRRLLPAALRDAFFAGELDCYEAAAEWFALSRQDAGHRTIVDRLLAMGSSFEEHGQIKPITGSWVPAEDGSYIFLIETGERRFWAACLQMIKEQRKDEPLLRVEVVEKPTRQRQVLENRHAENPSAVSQACEVASLILAELGKNPDGSYTDEYEYFRQARAQRMPAGLWDQIKPIMQLTRPRMVQLLNILQFPSSLLDMADRYRLPERVLREVLAFPPEQWDEMLKVSIQNELTSDEVSALAENDQARPGQAQAARPAKSSKGKTNPGKIATSGIRRFSNALVELDRMLQEEVIDQVADDLAASEEASDTLTFLEELVALIRVRIQSK